MSFVPPTSVPTKLQGISQEGGDGKWLNALRIRMKPGGLRVTAGGIPSLCLLELTCNPHDGFATIPGPQPPAPTPTRKNRPQLGLGQAVWLHKTVLSIILRTEAEMPD